MYSLVMLAALAAGPDGPRHWTCPVTPSNYGCGFWSGHDFFDCCAPARYGWVDCWTKGFGSYPGAARGFCGECPTCYPTFYRPPACGCGPCAPACGAKCGPGCSHDWCGYDWPIGNQPAYYTSVLGCPPCVTGPPYAYYTERNPCCTGGHFAFDTGLIGHGAGVGYSGFGGYGNFGFYGAVPTMHPPSTADLPPFPRPEYRKSLAPSGPAPMPPLPAGPTPPGIPMLPDVKKEEPKREGPKKEEQGLRDDRPAPAAVVLSVPARATVTVEGHPLLATGSARTFRTPALEPGASYVYTVTATLTVGGREEVETREVTVQAGQTARVSFAELFAKVDGAAALAAAAAGR